MKFAVAAAAFAAFLPAALAVSVSAVAYPTTDCTTTEFVAKFESANTCISTKGALALSIVGTSAGCQVYTFSDAACATFVNLVNLSEKCHNTEAFGSVQIRCITGG